jgi:glycosyltransferase involved in cell wall biosynthesis
LFVGGLEPRKGLEYLVHSLEYVLDEVPSARLVAVAKTGFRGTDEVGWFKVLSDRLGLAEHIDFLESVTQAELLRLYAECDILVLPSKTEGWGLALMEAMACKKPVVASRVGGVPELVRDGVDGVLVEAGDVQGLSKAIVKLLKDPALRTRMGEAGALRVLGFSWDSTAKVVLKAYESALTQSLRTRSRTGP